MFLNSQDFVYLRSVLWSYNLLFLKRELLFFTVHYLTKIIYNNIVVLKLKLERIVE